MLIGLTNSSLLVPHAPPMWCSLVPIGVEIQRGKWRGGAIEVSKLKKTNKQKQKGKDGVNEQERKLIGRLYFIHHRRHHPHPHHRLLSSFSLPS